MLCSIRKFSLNAETDGRTCHKACRMLLDMDKTCRVGWPVEHPRRQKLRAVDLVLWDEVSMTSRYALDAVEQFKRGLTGIDLALFGNKVFHFGGDFRQTLPIVIRGDGTAISQRCVLVSPQFCHAHKGHFQLTTNRRAQTRAVPHLALSYSPWLLQLDNDLLPIVKVSKPYAPKDLINIPNI
ncbi:hypothetical protein HUJ05_007618 [Dendroctonus ponderosae]|nr:hypothetical protein HUJ05_007618 [Dendroctonus ponderosae]